MAESTRWEIYDCYLEEAYLEGDGATSNIHYDAHRVGADDCTDRVEGWIRFFESGAPARLGSLSWAPSDVLGGEGIAEEAASLRQALLVDPDVQALVEAGRRRAHMRARVKQLLGGLDEHGLREGLLEGDAPPGCRLELAMALLGEPAASDSAAHRRVRALARHLSVLGDDYGERALTCAERLVREHREARGG